MVLVKQDRNRRIGHSFAQLRLIGAKLRCDRDRAVFSRPLAGQERAVKIGVFVRHQLLERLRHNMRLQ